MSWWWSQPLASRKARQSEQWEVWASRDQAGVERAATSHSEVVPKSKASVTLNNEMAPNPMDLNLREALEA